MEDRGDETTTGTVVYTIGHGRDSFGALQRRCAPHGITTLVDVRSRPFSRHAPDFVKDRLEQLCAEAGLGYRWLGAHLGGRPTDPSQTDAEQPDYRAMRAGAGFRAGLAELEGLARAGTVVVMCAEMDHTHCHRTLLIAPALVESGHEIRHITAEGGLTHFQPPLEW